MIAYCSVPATRVSMEYREYDLVTTPLCKRRCAAASRAVQVHRSSCRVGLGLASSEKKGGSAVPDCPRPGGSVCTPIPRAEVAPTSTDWF